MSRQLLVVGAGGHGRSIAEAALLVGWDDIRFVDDGYPDVASVLQWPVIGRSADVTHIAEGFAGTIVAIGNNAVRAQLCERIGQAGIALILIVHPRAWVSASASIGEGSAVMAGAVVGALARIGRGGIVNANATVDHDAELGDFAHLGVGVQLAGGVRVGRAAWLQAGCVAGYGVVVRDDAVHPPGSVL